MAKQKIAGKIVHHCRDEYGEIIIADDDGMRSLYFGGVIQTTILLERPEALLEDYSRAMMASLLFMDHPRSVLLIGLGGCALVHFLLKALPGAVIEVVEIRQKVIELAYDFFLLPRTDNLRLYNLPGQDFVAERDENSPKYDLIMVDAFDEGGPCRDVLSPSFLTGCRNMLGTRGIFEMNLWNGAGDKFSANCKSVQLAFPDGRLKVLFSHINKNAIVFGSDNPDIFGEKSAYLEKAQDLKNRHGINFPSYLKKIKKSCIKED